MKKTISYKLKQSTRLILFAVAGLALVTAALLPAALPRSADAAQLTSRSLTISSGVPNATSLTYTYGFTTQTTAAIQSIKLIMCTTAVGTYAGGSCTAPSGCTGGGNNCLNAGTEASRSGWTNSTTFARNATGGGSCTPANNVLCLDRTQAANETAGARTLGWNSQRNPTSTNTAFFIGIFLYSDTGWTTGVDSGTVASATVQTLTVNAAVAEVLNFCVGTTTVDNATGDVTGASADDCTGVSGTSMNIGTLDTSAINVSPVSTNGGDSNNAIAVLRTNAVNGATVSYDAIQQSGTNHQGTLRVSGASCNAGNVQTDQCIDAAGATQTSFTAGTEKFGMSIGAINCSLVSSYTCTFSSGTYNLVRDSNYDCTGNNTFSTTCSQGYAWVEDGTVTQIASSTGSTTKVVDDETLLIKFAATPSITTPFGAYTAQSDFIAVATY